MNESKKTDSIIIPKSIDLKKHVDVATTKGAPSFTYDKTRLKLKMDSTTTSTSTTATTTMSVLDNLPALGSAEKRKSSAGALDVEPVSKQLKSSISTTTATDSKELMKCEETLHNAVNDDENNKENKEKDKENEKGNQEVGRWLNKLDSSSLLEVLDSEDESFERALRESKEEHDMFTRIQSTRSGGRNINVNNSGTPFDMPNIDIIGSDSGDNVFDQGVVSLTEEEQIQRALNLSIRDLEKSQTDLLNSSVKCGESKEEDAGVVGGDVFDSNGSESLCREDNMGSDTIDGIGGADVGSQDNEYKLVGIVNHHGENTETGHYTSDSYDFKSHKWRSYNDSSVKEINEHEVRFSRGTSAYIVFYMHSKCYAHLSEL